MDGIVAGRIWTQSGLNLDQIWTEYIDCDIDCYLGLNGWVRFDSFSILSPFLSHPFYVLSPSRKDRGTQPITEHV
jgi:hypothetical protein